MGSTVNEWGTNQRMWTAPEWAFRPVGGCHQRMGEHTFVYSLKNSLTVWPEKLINRSMKNTLMSLLQKGDLFTTETTEIIETKYKFIFRQK